MMSENRGMLKTLYQDNIDYYQRDKSYILPPEKIAITTKCARIEPKIVSKNLMVQMAYNGAHQLAVAKQVSDFIDSGKGADIKLLVVNNVTKFFKESKDKNRAANVLKCWVFSANLVPNIKSRLFALQRRI